MKDAFDRDLREELIELYPEKVWSSLSVDMKEKLRTRLINSLKVNHMTVIVCKLCSLFNNYLSFIITQVPTDKDLNNRLKPFYVNRRSSLLISMDEERARKRKHCMKACKMTFVSCIMQLYIHIYLFSK